MEVPVKSTFPFACAVVLIASLSACRYEPPPQTGAPPAAAATASAPAAVASVRQPELAVPPGHPVIEGTGTNPVATTSAGTANLLTGQVVEAMDAAGYTYLKLRDAKGEVWVAVRQARLEKGAIVTVAAQITMKEFESKSLNRKFDTIVFGTLADAPGTMPAGAPDMTNVAPMPPGHPGVTSDMGGMGSPSRDVAIEIRVTKAEGPSGHTVDEIWASKASLEGKQVAVRGKVVKFLPEIMGKNWIHLQDGTGTRAAGTNDITVTTKDAAVAGDVVLIRGVVRTGLNLGAGYTYPVIIEEARVTK